MSNSRSKRSSRTLLDPESAAAFAYLIADFSLNACHDDLRLLLQLLGEWVEHADIEGWFTTCVMRLSGAPILPGPQRKALTLQRLRQQILDRDPRDRAELVGMHLDLVNADQNERAFLVVCQKLYREIGDTPASRVDEVAPTIAKMAQGLLEDCFRTATRFVRQRIARSPQPSPTATSSHASKRRSAAA